MFSVAFPVWSLTPSPIGWRFRLVSKATLTTLKKPRRLSPMVIEFTSREFEGSPAVLSLKALVCQIIGGGDH
jgi:hypothetical protein